MNIISEYGDSLRMEVILCQNDGRILLVGAPNIPPDGATATPVRKITVLMLKSDGPCATFAMRREA
jgi:hypothetical protein